MSNADQPFTSSNEVRVVKFLVDDEKITWGEGQSVSSQVESGMDHLARLKASLRLMETATFLSITPKELITALKYWVAACDQSIEAKVAEDTFKILCDHIFVSDCTIAESPYDLCQAAMMLFVNCTWNKFFAFKPAFTNMEVAANLALGLKVKAKRVLIMAEAAKRGITAQVEAILKD